MGKIEKHGEDLLYKQDNGEITALFKNYEEKRELVHEGSVQHKKIFYTLVALGVVYLFVLFLSSF